jgi:protoporphyrinogen oxidase
MAAATVLATHDIASTVFEAAQTLGGRARRVAFQGENLDNGLHILIGGYSETLRMIRLANESGRSQGLLRQPLQLRVEPGFRLHAWPLPRPLNVAAALLFASGLGIPAKLACDPCKRSSFDATKARQYRRCCWNIINRNCSSTISGNRCAYRH